MGTATAAAKNRTTKITRATRDRLINFIDNTCDTTNVPIKVTSKQEL